MPMLPRKSGSLCSTTPLPCWTSLISHLTPLFSHTPGAIQSYNNIRNCETTNPSQQYHTNHPTLCTRITEYCCFGCGTRNNSHLDTFQNCLKNFTLIACGFRHTSTSHHNTPARSRAVAGPCVYPGMTLLTRLNCNRLPQFGDSHSIGLDLSPALRFHSDLSPLGHFHSSPPSGFLFRWL